jgi:YHS domain-containing protein
MGKIITLLLVALLSYFSVKSWLAPRKPRKQDRDREDSPNWDRDRKASSPGEMVQDPVCGTFIEERTAVAEVVGGRAVYFCSARCRDRYQENPEEAQ